MIRRLPRSTLCPYTTLFRSDQGGGTYEAWTLSPTGGKPERAVSIRSEEHTSELQSHLNLGCRLLLEKNRPASPVRPSALRPPDQAGPLAPRFARGPSQYESGGHFYQGDEDPAPLHCPEYRAAAS